MDVDGPYVRVYVFESIELFPPLTISMTFFSPNQQRFLLFLALYP
jgi:hypothetical protein